MLYNIIKATKHFSKANSFSSLCKKPNYIYVLSTSLIGIGVYLSLSFNHNEEIKKLTKK